MFLNQPSPFSNPASKSNGTTVIVCPGGGYNILAYEHEGTQVCEWLNDLGVTAVLLKYRVPRRENRPHMTPAGFTASYCFSWENNHGKLILKKWEYLDFRLEVI